MTRLLALCADDYGNSAAISRGILALAARGRLSEVSCIVNASTWPEFARPLASLPAVAAGGVRMGLHFNLTEGRPLSPALARIWPRLPALWQLIMQAHLRRLPRAALREELRLQFEAFEQASGRAPAHIDGHQHVHHLPLLRDLVLEQVRARPGLLVRHTGHLPGPGHAVKRMLIKHTGGRVLGRQLEALGRQANTQLRGIHDFTDLDYRGLMQRWLAALPAHGALLICHPGQAAGAAADDPIAAARARELAYLDSPAFSADLAAADVRLAPSR